MTDREITQLHFPRDEPAPADLALVFGHHEPAWAAVRARRATDLYLAGHVPLLLLSGRGPAPPDGPSEAAGMAAVCRAAGVPEEALLLEERSQATWQNVAYGVELLRGRGLLAGITRVLLVSCPWHMYRVAWIARRGLPEGIALLCCPHDEGCTAETWASMPAYRAMVLRELELVRELSSLG